MSFCFYRKPSEDEQQGASLQVSNSGSSLCRAGGAALLGKPMGHHLPILLPKVQALLLHPQ